MAGTAKPNTLQTIFNWCIIKNDKAQPLTANNNEIFHNRFIKCSVWNYDILERSTILDEKIHISSLELQKWSLAFVISFSKVQFLNLGFGIEFCYSLWDQGLQK